MIVVSGFYALSTMSMSSFLINVVVETLPTVVTACGEKTLPIDQRIRLPRCSAVGRKKERPSH